MVKLDILASYMHLSSVCPTLKSELGDTQGVLTPPQEVSGLCDYQDDLFFPFYDIHHGPGILADQVVQVGMLDAATAKEDDHVRNVAAGQEHPDLKSKCCKPPGPSRSTWTLNTPV